MQKGPFKRCRSDRAAISPLVVSGSLDASAVCIPSTFGAKPILLPGPAAAAEFQRSLDHRSIVRVDPVDAMARLQLARALTLSGDTAKAKSAYNDLFTLWKSADPDIPILKQARAEYAGLP